MTSQPSPSASNLCPKGHDLDAPGGRVSDRPNLCRLCANAGTIAKAKAERAKLDSILVMVKKLPDEQGEKCRKGHLMTPTNSIVYERAGKRIVNCRVCGRYRPKTKSTASDEMWTNEILRLGDQRYLATPTEKHLIDQRLKWIERQRQGEGKD